jgi:glycosyltransferase involved in cell wall biosynthesis
MAMSKALIASDIGGHRELIEDGTTGLLFKSESVPALESRCVELLGNGSLRWKIARQARTWVATHRDWACLVKRYVELYSKLAGRCRSNAG